MVEREEIAKKILEDLATPEGKDRIAKAFQELAEKQEKCPHKNMITNDYTNTPVRNRSCYCLDCGLVAEGMETLRYPTYKPTKWRNIQITI